MTSPDLLTRIKNAKDLQALNWLLCITRSRGFMAREWEAFEARRRALRAQQLGDWVRWETGR